jgi:hypothetical protein
MSRANVNRRKSAGRELRNGRTHTFANDLAVATIELVMAWSPEREDVVKTTFLDFIRSKK